MKKNNIYFKGIYAVTDKVFNVDKNGAKTHVDPITGVKYIYGSANNVKHCIREEFVAETDLTHTKTYFQRKVSMDKGKIKIDQGGVFSEIKPNDFLAAIFGAWCSFSFGDDSKYKDIAIKSSMNVGEFKPLHPYMVTTNQMQGGVNCGHINSQIMYTNDKNKNGYALSVEEFVKNNPQFDKEESIQRLLDERRTMNIFGTFNMTTSGIYQHDITFNMNTFGKMNINKFENDELKNEIHYMVDNSDYKLQTINNLNYLVPSKQTIYDLWESMVNVIMNWDFQSNDARHGSVMEQLRISFALNEPTLWQEANNVEVVDDNQKTARIDFHDEFEEVKSFNTTTLKKYCNCDNLTTDVYAHKNAIKTLVELGKQAIDKAYPQD